MRIRAPKGVQAALAQRRDDLSWRELRPLAHGGDLCSNDYLGIARRLSSRWSSPEFAEFACESVGATGSRLISGTTRQHEELEDRLAIFHGTQSALLFGSGYEANLGLMSSLGKRHDTIVYDELLHASMRDGIRLSAARSFSFRHNDPDSLRRKLREARGEVFVAVESLYSMDGDLAPLEVFCDVCEEAGAFLIVDEAHSTGMYGEEGQGLTQSLSLQDRVFARVHTFGKAVGYRGAAIVGSESLRDYLINFARSFIYATAPDLLSVRMIHEAYTIMSEAHDERRKVRDLVEGVSCLKKEFLRLPFVLSETAIQGVLLRSNATALAAEAALGAAGYMARAVRSPTVAVGSERIRLCLHSFNSLAEVRGALAVIDKIVGERGACA